MKPVFAPFLFGIGVISASMQASAGQEYAVTTGPAGIFVLELNGNSPSWVKGTPFVPAAIKAQSYYDSSAGPVLTALDPTGAYLYAIYGGCSGNYVPLDAFSFKMVNGVPYQISQYLDYTGGDNASCAAPTQLVVSAHHLFALVPTIYGNPAFLLVFTRSNGALTSVNRYGLGTWAADYSTCTSCLWNVSTLTVDASEHFAYVTFVPNTLTPTVGWCKAATATLCVAVYDISGLPSKAPQLVLATPEAGGVLVGAQ